MPPATWQKMADETRSHEYMPTMHEHADTDMEIYGT